MSKVDAGPHNHILLNPIQFNESKSREVRYTFMMGM